MRRVSSSCSLAELEAIDRGGAERGAGQQARRRSARATSAPRTRADIEHAARADGRAPGSARAPGAAVETETGLGARAGQRVDQRLHQRARGRRDRHHHAVGAGLGRLAPAERRVVRAPRRQPVDLRAHHAVEELGRALRQFERPEQEARGLAAPARRGCRAAAPRCCRDAARRSCRRRSARARTAGRTARRVRPGSRTCRRPPRSPARSCARGTTTAARRSRPRRCRSSAREGLDVAEAGHRVAILLRRSAGASSMSSRQVRMRYGVGAVVEYEDHDFACHALPAVERDARGHAQRLAAGACRERLCGAEQRQQRLGVLRPPRARCTRISLQPCAGPCRAAPRAPAAPRPGC